MTSHAVQQINEGENLKITFFEEGSPNMLYAQGIISGNETNPVVVEIFKYLSSELTKEQNEMFYPEKIYKNSNCTIENYPTEIMYADMSGNTPERKAELLAKWSH